MPQKNVNNVNIQNMRTNSTIQNKAESSIEIIRGANNTNDENTPEYCHVVSQCSNILGRLRKKLRLMI